MPRPLWKPLAFALAAAALPPPVLHAALAATAGTLFEAAPFVLLAEAAGTRRRAFPAFAALAGCGCGGRVPGALSLPATALAWLAFGPAVALARLAAGLAWYAVTARRHRAGADQAARPAGDAFADLSALVAPAFAASLAAQALAAHAASVRADGLAGAALTFGAGIALGAVAPCATAGVAIAAALAGSLPAAAAGLLVSAGLLRLRPAHHGSARATRAASFLLAGALIALALRGPSGLVNPRVLPLFAPAAALALLRPRARTASPAAGVALVPALMAGALLAGSPPPVYRLDASEAAFGFPGSRLAFTGVALADGPATLVERFAIACCRLDASAVSVTLNRRIAVPDGTWLTVQGTVERDPSGAMVLRTSRWRRVPPPADPFIYR
jgi:hypothetical protein